MSSSRTIIILTLNEIDGLRAMFDRLPLSCASEVLAVDGGSTDGTLEFFTSKGVKVHRHKRKGRGGAFLDGMEQTRGEHVVFYSPDGNEDPDDIPRLFVALEGGCDMAIASRFCPGSRNEEDDDLLPLRSWANQAFTWTANALWNRGPYVTDTINGFRGVRRAAFEAMAPDAAGFAIEYQLSIRAMKLGLKVVELPTKEGARIGGESKAKSVPTGLRFLRFLLREYRVGLSFRRAGP